MADSFADRLDSIARDLHVALERVRGAASAARMADVPGTTRPARDKLLALAQNLLADAAECHDRAGAVLCPSVTDDVMDAEPDSCDLASAADYQDVQYGPDVPL